MCNGPAQFKDAFAGRYAEQVGLTFAEDFAGDLCPGAEGEAFDVCGVACEIGDVFGVQVFGLVVCCVLVGRFAGLCVKAGGLCGRLNLGDVKTFFEKGIDVAFCKELRISGLYGYDAHAEILGKASFGRQAGIGFEPF